MYSTSASFARPDEFTKRICRHRNPLPGIGKKLNRRQDSAAACAGLYLIDEPEAALSAQRQLSLLVILHDLIKRLATNTSRMEIGPTTELLHALLLLQVHRRAADPFRLEIDSHLDTVSDLDEGNTAVHPILLTVEGHRPVNVT